MIVFVHSCQMDFYTGETKLLKVGEKCDSSFLLLKLRGTNYLSTAQELSMIRLTETIMKTL
jgi:hypothetical protein